MPSTYEPIATTTLGSANSTITFSSIPSTYTDLRLVLIPTVTSSGLNTFLRFNSDTGSNYSFTQMSGNGSSATSAQNTNNTQLNFNLAGPDTSIPTLYTFDIFSYSGSTNKTLLISESSDKNGSGATMRRVGLWRNTSAINSINLITDSTTWKIGTIATLYGIKAA
jgi:hypothetical protein